jgi:hypothetical protein
LTRRSDDNDTEDQSDTLEQPDIFVYESRFIGIDDVPSKTPPSIAEQARKNAADEIDEIVSCYDRYVSGSAGPWLIKADRLVDRLDAKYLRA